MIKVVRSLKKPRTLAAIGWVAYALLGLWTFGGALHFVWEWIADPAGPFGALPAVSGLSPGAYFWFVAIPLALQFGCFFTVAGLLAFRLPKDRTARFLGLFLMAFGVAGPVTLAPGFIGFWDNAAAWFVVPFTLFTYLSWPLMPVFFVVYPDGKFVPGWMRWATVYGLFFTVSWATFPEVFGRPSAALSAWIFLSVVAIFSCSLYSQINRYRFHADAVQRQQIKWMVYGIGVVTLLQIAHQVLVASLLGVVNETMQPRRTSLWLDDLPAEWQEAARPFAEDP